MDHRKIGLGILSIMLGLGELLASRKITRVN